MSARSQAQITFYSKTEDGLSADYRAQDDGEWAYFDVLPPIDGFPAVARDITDNRDNGTCGRGRPQRRTVVRGRPAPA